MTPAETHPHRHPPGQRCLGCELTELLNSHAAAGCMTVQTATRVLLTGIVQTLAMAPEEVGHAMADAIADSLPGRLRREYRRRRIRAIPPTERVN